MAVDYYNLGKIHQNNQNDSSRINLGYKLVNLANSYVKQQEGLQNITDDACLGYVKSEFDKRYQQIIQNPSIEEYGEQFSNAFSEIMDAESLSEATGEDVSRCRTFIEKYTTKMSASWNNMQNEAIDVASKAKSISSFKAWTEQMESDPSITTQKTKSVDIKENTNQDNILISTNIDVGSVVENFKNTPYTEAEISPSEALRQYGQMYVKKYSEYGMEYSDISKTYLWSNPIVQAGSAYNLSLTYAKKQIEDNITNGTLSIQKVRENAETYFDEMTKDIDKSDPKTVNALRKYKESLMETAVQNYTTLSENKMAESKENNSLATRAIIDLENSSSGEISLETFNDIVTQYLDYSNIYDNQYISSLMESVFGYNKASIAPDIVNALEENMDSILSKASDQAYWGTSTYTAGYSDIKFSSGYSSDKALVQADTLWKNIKKQMQIDSGGNPVMYEYSTSYAPLVEEIARQYGWSDDVQIKAQIANSIESIINNHNEQVSEGMGQVIANMLADPQMDEKTYNKKLDELYSAGLIDADMYLDNYNKKKDRYSTEINDLKSYLKYALGSDIYNELSSSITFYDDLLNYVNTNMQNGTFNDENVRKFADNILSQYERDGFWKSADKSINKAVFDVFGYDTINSIYSDSSLMDVYNEYINGNLTFVADNDAIGNAKIQLSSGNVEDLDSVLDLISQSMFGKNFNDLDNDSYENRVKTNAEIAIVDYSKWQMYKNTFEWDGHDIKEVYVDGFGSCAIDRSGIVYMLANSSTSMSDKSFMITKIDPSSKQFRDAWAGNNTVISLYDSPVPQVYINADANDFDIDISSKMAKAYKKVRVAGYEDYDISVDNEGNIYFNPYDTEKNKEILYTKIDPNSESFNSATAKNGYMLDISDAKEPVAIYSPDNNKKSGKAYDNTEYQVICNLLNKGFSQRR